MTAQKITIARGDGIGPEIMDVTLQVLKAAKADLIYDEIEIGEKVYQRGFGSGIEDKAWDSLLENKVFLKAPITTPQGGGFKSLNVTVRKTLGLYANVRPCKSYHPFIQTKHPTMDLVIVRENEEDLYAGIEHRQTNEVYQCLKLITRPGCEKIIRYAFEFTKRSGRKKMTCLSKDNIMKMTDGLFHKVFDEIGAEYPEIEKEHWIIDIGTAKVADTPEVFDVIVTPNLYGDILSDVAAQITGSVGLGGSSNIGESCAMFEAIHGSAPQIAGQNVANPSGLILAAIQMLNHIGQGQVAETIHNAWLATIEDGVHTPDIYRDGTSSQKVGTQEFGKALIARLGKKPRQFSPVRYEATSPLVLKYEGSNTKAKEKKLYGVDVFVCEEDRNPEHLARRIQKATEGFDASLEMITNRGVKVYPHGHQETFCTDHWRCRFVLKQNLPSKIWSLLQLLGEAGIETIKTENLYLFDGEKGFSVGQGQ